MLANTSIKVVLKKLFLSISNADVEFAELRKVTWRSYTTAKALSTISLVELIGKREFAKAALDENSETFVVHVLALETITIHSSQAAQIVILQCNKASIKILAKYSNYADLFSTDLVIELPENTGMNKHIIKLIDGKHLPYAPIHTLSPVELETLKTYIETHLKTRFI